jgi:hypothetical protein
MQRRLPPLNALRAFEAAARLGSFKQAAAEMGHSDFPGGSRATAGRLEPVCQLQAKAHHAAVAYRFHLATLHRLHHAPPDFGAFLCDQPHHNEREG